MATKTVAKKKDSAKKDLSPLEESIRSVKSLQTLPDAGPYRIRIVADGGKGNGPALKVASAFDVYSIFAPIVLQYDREAFFVLHLDVTKKLISYEVVSIGSLSSAVVSAREVFKGAILSNSHSIICLHNHPSGDANPSNEDKLVTAKIKDAGDIIGIPLLDHIIVGEQGAFYSFLEDGKLARQPEKPSPHPEKCNDQDCWKNKLGHALTTTRSGNAITDDVTEVLYRLSFVESIIEHVESSHYSSIQGLRFTLRDSVDRLQMIEDALSGEERA